VKPTRRASACMISGSDASRFETSDTNKVPHTTGTAKSRPVAGNTCDPSHSRAGNGCPAKCHHRRAESAQLECCEDSNLVPYVYLENQLVFQLQLHLCLPSIIILLGCATATFSNPSIIDLLATDRLPTVSASDAFRNLSDDHQSPSNAYTDISELDNALGGGFECGRVTELWGPPGAGKTAIAYVHVT
jgi:hypothetical protein